MSAVIAGGPPSRVIERVYEGILELILPEMIAVELARVLTAKFEWDGTHAVALIDELARVAADVPETPPTIPEVTGHPIDDAILACATDARADILVTGDAHHLLPLRRHKGVRIARPQEVLAELGPD